MSSDNLIIHENVLSDAVSESREDRAEGLN